jgi:hypothetical protein
VEGKLINEVEFEDGSAIVLRYMEGSVDPYVTHWRGQGGDYYWGHYFRTEDTARADFDIRVGREDKTKKRGGE